MKKEHDNADDVTADKNKKGKADQDGPTCDDPEFHDFVERVFASWRE